MTEFDALDQLFSAKERVQLELGWAVNDWLKEQGPKDAPRAALSYALDVLSDRYQDTFSSMESARRNISDWARVTRYFTRDMVAELQGQFTYHHLRSCFVGGDWPEADKEATLKNVTAAVAYASEHEGKWPPVNTAERAAPDLIDRARKACRRVVDAGMGTETFREVCLLVANYAGGEDWAQDEKQQKMELK